MIIFASFLTIIIMVIIYTYYMFLQYIFRDLKNRINCLELKKIKKPRKFEIKFTRSIIKISNYRLFLATSTNCANPFGSAIANSESIFLFTSIPAFFRPFMNLEYDISFILQAALIL